MNILFYSPLQSRSKDTESIMEGFVSKGEKVFLLTQYKSPTYHEACRKIGVNCFSTSIEGTAGIVTKLRQFFFLIRFCRVYNIDIVYSQLEPANLIAVLAQFFIRSKVVLCRHHVDEVEIASTKRAHWISVLTYKIAKHILVVSRRAKEYMTERERISPDKIHFIPLGYNFSLWPHVQPDFVSRKKKQINAKLTLISAARLVSAKRVNLCLHLLSKIVKSNVDCKLIVLGEGEDLDNLKNLAIQLAVNDRVYFEGYVHNVVDYILASDIMIHFSLIDSSPAIIKEAGLAAKPVIVCRDVGDCDDYIVDGVNSFLVNREDPVSEAFEKVMHFFINNSSYSEMGFKLKECVCKNFSIEFVLPQYQRLNEQLLNE